MPLAEHCCEELQREGPAIASSSDPHRGLQDDAPRSVHCLASTNTKTPFNANVDWGDSPVRSDTLSLNSSEKYRWFNNDDLESCTHNGDDEGNSEDEGSVTNCTYF